LTLETDAYTALQLWWRTMIEKRWKKGLVKLPESGIAPSRRLGNLLAEAKTKNNLTKIIIALPSDTRHHITSHDSKNYTPTIKIVSIIMRALLI